MDEKTNKYASISESPGIFGLNFHNEGYKILGINAVYFPLKVTPNNLEAVMRLIRDNFQGCSVSMPHKTNVIRYLDSLDEPAQKIGAVNTVLNKEKNLIGFNTDYYGARRAISEFFELQNKEVLMLGAGGVARAVGHAVKGLGGKLTITNRDNKKASELACLIEASTLNWNERGDFSGYLLINATSVGFQDKEEIPLNPSAIEKYGGVMDVVIGNTKLIREATSREKRIISGRTMTVYQAAKQFEIYTGRQLPKSFIDKFLTET